MKFNKIYLDMDGVLADFDLHFKNIYGIWPKEIKYNSHKDKLIFWDMVYETPRFFRNIPPKPNAFKLLELCEETGAKVVILSAPSRTNTPICVLDKRAWVDQYLGEDFPAIFENNKHIFARSDRLLVDDTEKMCINFSREGGHSYLYEDEKIKKFAKYLNELK